MTIQERLVAPAADVASYPSWDAPLFVWGTWSLSVISAVVCALRGRRFPYVDDWYLVPVLTGAEPVTLSWLWAQHGVHRIPLPRLIFLGLYNRVLGYDFRSGPMFSALVLSVLALAMIVAVKRLRGWTTYSDAFFPLALLHWGIDALTWNFGLQFLCSTVLASSFLLLVVRDRVATVAGGFLAGSLLVLLPTTGVNGLALAPCLALFLGYSGFRQWQRQTRANVHTALVMFSSVIGCLFLCGLYVFHYQTAGPREYASPGIRATLKTALMFAAAGFGNGSSDYFTQWPWGARWRLVVPALLTVTLVLLFRRLLTQPSERNRIVGFLAFLGALTMLAVAVGHGRGGRDWDDVHYGTLALPFLCFVYFVWETYGSPPAKRFVEMYLFCVMCAVFILNGPPRHLAGFNAAAAEVAEVQRDVQAGMSRCAVVDRHLRMFWWWDTETSWGRAQGEREGRDRVGRGLGMLGRVGVTPFRLFGNDSPSDRC